MAYIYKISNKINNKCYIGKTELSIEQRFQEHCKEANRNRNTNRPLYSAMCKYGIENFYIELIEETEIPNEREQYWIKHFDSFKSGYNATKGGDGKSYLDKDAIYQCYLENKGRNKTAQIFGCSEKTVTKILHQKEISQKEINNNGISQLSKKVAMINKENMKIEQIFSSAHEAGRFLGKSHQHISDVCRGIRKTAYGYMWKYI